MEKKELHSMKKLRGLMLSLGLAALLALSARDAQAGNLTLTVQVGVAGPSISFDFNNNLFAQAPPSSSQDNVAAIISAVNGFLNGAGSMYNIASTLGGSSTPLPGDPSGTNVNLTGDVTIANPGGDATLFISAMQTGFTTPSGPGILTSASSGVWTVAPVGQTVTAMGTLDHLPASVTSLYTNTGVANPQSYGNVPLGDSTPATGVPTYGLTASILIVSPANATTGTTSFSNSVIFHAVPEPASLVMMVTGMPLPLVVMGLLRRRRATA